MVGLLVPIALALTGCSSSTPAGSSSPTTATTNVAVPPPSAPVPTPVAQTAGPAPAPVATYAYTAKSGDGTVEGGTIAFYKPRSATSFLPWEGWPSSNCQPDVARDAYLPVAVTIENRTPNFPATTRVGLEVQPGAPYPVTRDEGSTCQSTQGTSSDGVGNEGEAFNAAPAGGVDIAMDGVAVNWTWDAASTAYLRFQGGKPHDDEDQNPSRAGVRSWVSRQGPCRGRQ